MPLCGIWMKCKIFQTILHDILGVERRRIQYSESFSCEDGYSSSSQIEVRFIHWERKKFEFWLMFSSFQDAKLCIAFFTVFTSLKTIFSNNINNIREEANKENKQIRQFRMICVDFIRCFAYKIQQQKHNQEVIISMQYKIQCFFIDCYLNDVNQSDFFSYRVVKTWHKFINFPSFLWTHCPSPPFKSEQNKMLATRIWLRYAHQTVPGQSVLQKQNPSDLMSKNNSGNTQ